MIQLGPLRTFQYRIYSLDTPFIRSLKRLVRFKKLELLLTGLVDAPLDNINMAGCYDSLESSNIRDILQDSLGFSRVSEYLEDPIDLQGKVMLCLDFDPQRYHLQWQKEEADRQEKLV